MAKPLVIFGTGPYAEVARYLWEHDGGRRVAAFAVDAEFLPEYPRLRELDVYAFHDVVERFPPETHDLFVAVGARGVNSLRASICDRAREAGYTLPTYISTRATTFPDLSIGDNSFVFEDNTLQPFVTIGSNVVLWSGNHVGHHTSIRDNCFITSHVVISGNVTVGENCFIGVNASIRDGIEIAPRCVIGAGALIMRPTQTDELYIGPRTKPDERRSDAVGI